MLRQLVARVNQRARAREQRLRSLVWRWSAPLREIEAVQEFLTWLADSTKRPAPFQPLPFTLPDETASIEQLAPVTLPSCDEPEVSIVIVAGDRPAHLHACLASIAAHSDGPRYEVIVVDGGSNAATSRMLASVGGLRVVRENGIAAARGRYLLFLDPDSEVRDGWLRELHDTALREARVGLVTPRLLFPDGRVQWAGGGKAASDPHDPRGSYARSIGDCPPACTLIARELYASLPDSNDDLALRVRRAGHRVWVQPLAQVVRHAPLSDDKKSLARDRAPLPRGRVLIVDATLPQPDRDSGSLRMFNLMQVLRQLDFQVSFLPVHPTVDESYARALRRHGIEVLLPPYAASPRHHLRRHARDYDLIVLSRAEVAALLLDVARHAAQKAKRRPRIVFDTVDLHFLREQRQALLAGDPELERQARKRRDDELRYTTLSDCTLVVSPVEKALLETALPNARVRIVSNIHAVHGLEAPFAARSGIVFVGGFRHRPNVDAARWLVSEILPRLHARLPGLVLELVGSDPPDEIMALAGEHVVVTGFVPDLAPILRRCRLSVAPLRYGAGVKGKINLSLSYGVPVVATTLAVEGMHLAPGQEVLVADDADRFAAETARLYADEALWQRLSAAGLAHTERHFSFAAARAAVAALTDELLPR